MISRDKRWKDLVMRMFALLTEIPLVIYPSADAVKHSGQQMQHYDNKQRITLVPLSTKSINSYQKLLAEHLNLSPQR